MTVGCPECDERWDDDAHHLPGSDCPNCGEAVLQVYGDTSLPHAEEIGL